MLGITSYMCERNREQISDKYGRWCGYSLAGRDGKEIIVLTAYSVSQDIAVGEDTLYSQQKLQYLREYNDNGIMSDKEAYTDPKKRFVKDLRNLLQKAVNRQSDIILTGDFNNVIREGNNALTKLISGFGLIDVHSNKRGYNTDLPTYKRGPRRLDYMFVSRRLIDHIKRCGYEKVDARIVSNHCGYYADFFITGLFDR